MTATATRDESFFSHRDSGRLGAQQQQIMDRIGSSNIRHGRHDFSLREIAAITGMEINAVSGRVNELKRIGLLVEAVPRKCRVSGRTITPVEAA